jgi:hypothetical protein
LSLEPRALFQTSFFWIDFPYFGSLAKYSICYYADFLYFKDLGTGFVCFGIGMKIKLTINLKSLSIMKTKFKVLIAAALFVGLGSSAFAQTVTANTTMTASATILSNLAIVKNVDLTFGQVSNSKTPTMNANSATKTDVGEAATLGKFTVTGLAGASVQVDFTGPTLDLTNGGSSIVFTPSVYRTEKSTLAYGETGITTGSSYNINSSVVEAQSVAGTDYFYVGGNIVVGTAAEDPAGTYTGTFTMTVTYN